MANRVYLIRMISNSAERLHADILSSVMRYTEHGSIA